VEGGVRGERLGRLLLEGGDPGGVYGHFAFWGGLFYYRVNTEVKSFLLKPINFRVWILMGIWTSM
jgi:hypothetical protein